MRNIGKRLGAILLSALMVLSLIGVEPKKVSAEAGSNYSYGNFGGGTTEVVIDIGVRFLLVNYDTYKAWKGTDNRSVDLRTTNRSKVKMKNDIKSSSYLRHLNWSNSAIYVGYGGEIGCAYGTYSKAGLKSIKSYSWNSIGKVIKYMTGSSTSVKNAWTTLKSNRTNPDNWKKAFDKLEARLLKVSYDDSQKYLKRTFKAYNAKKNKNATYRAANGYYLIVEPVAYVKRGNGVVAISAQDMYKKFNTDDKSLLGTYLKGVVSGKAGITLKAGTANPLRNLSQLLYQKNFAYPNKKKIKADGSASKMTHSYQDNWKFYRRGGYACIVPKPSSGHKDATYQVYHTAVYNGAVGDSGGSLKSSSSSVVERSATISNNYDSDYYALNVGNYILSATDDSQTVASLKTAVSAINGNYNNNKPFKINWANGSVSLDIGNTWGTSSGSTFSSNGNDYVVTSIGSVTNYQFNAVDDTDGDDDVLDDEADDNDEDADATNENDGGGHDDITQSSSLGDGNTTDDNPDPDASEDNSEVSEINKDTESGKIGFLSQSFDRYGYVSTAGTYVVNSSAVNETLKNSFDKAYDGLKAYNKVSGNNKYVNAEFKNGETNDSKKSIVNDIPYTSSVLVKKSSITSYGYEVTYDASNNTLSTAVAKTSGGTSTGSGSVTYKTFNGSANSSNYGKVKGDKNAFYVVAVPNTSQIGRGQAAADYVKSKLTSSSTDDFMNKFEALANDNNFAIKRDCEGGDVIKVGAYQTKNSSGVATGLDGYTVVFIGIKGDIPLTGEEVLESYQLNNIDGDIASTFANQHNNANLIFTSRKVSTYKYNGNHTTQSCSICGASWNVLGSPAKSYNVNYKDKSDDSNKKYTIAYDNEKLGNYLIQTTINGGNIANRSTLKNSGENVNTSSTTKKFTYAFNLVRKLFEDKTASSLTANNGINSDVTGVLKMSYGNVPSNVTEINKKRDANAFVGNTLKETLKWTGTYTDTTEYNGNGKWRLANIDTFTHTCYDGSRNRHDTLVKNKYTGDDWSESIKPFKLNKIPMENAKIVVTEKAKKYQTENIATGKNENQDGIIRTTGVSGMDAKDINEDSILDNDTRYAYLEKHDITGDNIEISFYPEVKMMMYGLASGHNSVSSSESVYKKALYTMGEKKRTAQSSSLYLYRISSKKTVDGVGQKLTGKIYSDDMTTNSAGTGNGNTPVIYAGGNVSLKVDGANMNLNLYGYSVDLVNKAKDGTGFKINDTDTLTYKSVVDDESDIYAIWGNEETPAGGANIRTSNKLFNDYKAWVANMSNLDNYGADVTLKVADTTKEDGVKEYNNFSTTIGKLIPETGTLGDTGNWASKEDGVYPIAVYNGKVFSAKDTAEEQALSKGYWNLVAQVQKDYNCDEETAIKVLDESGMFDAIYKAIESSTSEFNKSGKAVSVSGEEATNQNTAMLGDGKNWYDEVVKTFCIRRYVTETLHFEGTILSDKIDYDAAPKDNSTSSGLNDKQTKYNKANAKWYVSFYLKGNPNQGSVESPIAETKKMYHTVGADYNPVFYNPSDANSAVSFENAKNSFTVLTEKLHVDGADFIIPSSATTDESN